MKKNRLLEYAMFYGASPIIFDRAKQLRKSMTPAEKKLWEIIRTKQLNGLRFRRQHPLNAFIADFYCSELKLVIEVDGGIHNQQKQVERDNGRDAFMKEQGITVIRFTNEDVFQNIEYVKIGEVADNLQKNKQKGGA